MYPKTSTLVESTRYNTRVQMHLLEEPGVRIRPEGGRHLFVGLELQRL